MIASSLLATSIGRDVMVHRLREETYFHQSYVVIWIITVMNLSSIDLNLFLVLHVVLEERSATGAARRLNVTQSAVSNALARLRHLYGDPLVVRSGRGLVPTPLAERLAPIIDAAVVQLRAAIAVDSRFDA